MEEPDQGVRRRRGRLPHKTYFTNHWDRRLVRRDIRLHGSYGINKSIVSIGHLVEGSSFRALYSFGVFT
jgi:hypothetical protein